MRLRLRAILLLLSAWTAISCQLAWAISEKQEIEIGRQGAAKAEAKYGTVKDKATLQRAKKLGKLISENASRKSIKYHFSVLNCKDVNALAFPGGYIYFTSGIMKLMNDEQLAFVTGHEVSHVEHRDSVKAIESAQYRALGIGLLQSFVKGANTNLSRSLMSMTNTVISNRYSQSAEFAADENGIYLMAAAGFNPYKSIEALSALQKLGGKDMSGFLNSLLSTHPITKDRIERAKRIAPQAAAKYPDYIGAEDNAPAAQADNASSNGGQKDGSGSGVSATDSSARVQNR